MIHQYTTKEERRYAQKYGWCYVHKEGKVVKHPNEGRETTLAYADGTRKVKKEERSVKTDLKLSPIAARYTGKKHACAAY